MNFISHSLAIVWLQLSTFWIGLAWNFFILLAVCYPLEKLFPARNQKFIRPGWATDCVFYITQHAFLEGFMLTLFTAIAGFITPLACVQFLHSRVGQATRVAPVSSGDRCRGYPRLCLSPGDACQ